MARISAEQAGGVNRLAFLDMLAFAEGTSTSPITKDDGYDVIVTGMKGPQRFAGYDSHPNVIVKINRDQLYSTAAGRYQLLYRYWLTYKRILNLPDFSPVSQDKIALQQIKEKNGLSYIDSGDILSAVGKCCFTWASLPGNNYGQNPKDMVTLLRAYAKAGGSLSGDSYDEYRKSSTSNS